MSSSALIFNDYRGLDYDRFEAVIWVGINSLKINRLEMVDQTGIEPVTLMP